MRVHNLLVLFHLLTRHTKGKEPLIDYFQSHVVTSYEYLDILLGESQWKKEVVKEIRTCKRKEKGNNELNE
jgi:hypothetical protein